VRKNELKRGIKMQHFYMQKILRGRLKKKALGKKKQHFYIEKTLRGTPGKKVRQ